MEYTSDPATLPDFPDPSAPAATFRDFPWTWKHILIGIAPLLVARLLPYVIDTPSIALVARWIWLPASVMAQAWMLIYPLAILSRHHARLTHFPRPRSLLIETLAALLTLVVLTLAMILLVPLINQAFGDVSSSPGPLAPLFRSLDDVLRWAGFALAVIVAPVAEEVFHRGMLYNMLQQRIGRIIAAILHAVVFGLLHPFPLNYIIQVALVGLTLAFLYEWRKTLLAPMLLHLIVNFVSMIVMIQTLTTEADAPRLGIQFMPDQQVCRIRQVEPNSGADQAGLQPGDIVTAVDDYAVSNVSEVIQIVREKNVGDYVDVDFTRGQDSYTVPVLLKRWPR